MSGIKPRAKVAGSGRFTRRYTAVAESVSAFEWRVIFTDNVEGGSSESVSVVSTGSLAPAASTRGTIVVSTSSPPRQDARDGRVCETGRLFRSMLSRAEPSRL